MHADVCLSVFVLQCSDDLSSFEVISFMEIFFGSTYDITNKESYNVDLNI